MPARPPFKLREAEQKYFERRGEGIMYLGDSGTLVAGFNGQNPHVYPESAKWEYTPPRRDPAAASQPPTPPKDGAIHYWIEACKAGSTAPLAADFASQTASTEGFLLGCLAQRKPNEPFE